MPCLVTAALVVVIFLPHPGHFTDPDFSLILDVPFNNVTKLTDRVCNLKPISSGKVEIVHGPGNDSAATITADEFSELAHYRYLPIKDGFTICFYYYQYAKKTFKLHPSALFLAVFSNNSDFVSVWADPDQKVIRIRLYENNHKIQPDCNFYIANPLNEWGYNCIALDFHRLYTCSQRNSNEHSCTQTKLDNRYQPSNMGLELRVGQAITDDNSLIHMNSGDSIACLSLYNTAMYDAMQNASVDNRPIRNCDVLPKNESSLLNNICVLHANPVRNNNVDLSTTTPAHFTGNRKQAVAKASASSNFQPYLLLHAAHILVLLL